MSLSLRDRYFALRVNPDEREAAALRAEVDALEVEPATRVQGLSLSWFPTRRFKQLRFLEAEQIDPSVRAWFARPCPELPTLAAAFVDPEEFCFRTFENILGLDRLFPPIGPRALRCGALQRLGDGVQRFSLKLSDELRARLAQLDGLGLHVPPRDPGSRGGSRFIFHSAALADGLTEALRGVLPKSMAAGFVRVNPVFRCNRFEPGDPPFAAHVDSPYSDPSRSQISKYTLLLYLSGGRGAPALRVGDLAIEQIDALTGFVFDQALEHEGGPYLAGRKLFLRTELIYVAPNLRAAPGLAELFAKACYLDGHSVFAPELARFAAAAYDRAAAAHWQGLPATSRPPAEPFVHKQYAGLHYVSDGYRFWFRKPHVSLIEAAALTLLDVLAAQIDGVPFRQRCELALLRPPFDVGSIPELLASFEPPREPPFGRLDKPNLIPAPEQPLPRMDFPRSPDFDDGMPDDWDPTRHEDVVDELARARRYALDRLFAAPILLLGTELFLDPARFVIAGDKIHVLSRDRLAPVHFAGAVFWGPGDFVGTDLKIDALAPLVPPIAWHETDDLWQLSFDLFRNDWMVGHTSEPVPVPRIIDDPRADANTTPWLNAASAPTHSRASIRAELDRPLAPKPPRKRG